jgi:choline monooxygenase
VGPFVDFLPFADYVPMPERGRTYLVRANWALYVDNYLEGFHIPYIHAALNATLDYASYRTELLRHGNLQVGTAADSEPAFELPPGHPLFGERVGALYFWMFPNLMLNFYPWGLSVNVVRPQGVSLTKVEFVPFVARPELLDQGAGGALDRVEREDEAVVESVQVGLRSRFYDRGRYAVEREKGVHQFHRMLAESLA